MILQEEGHSYSCFQCNLYYSRTNFTLPITWNRAFLGTIICSQLILIKFTVIRFVFEYRIFNFCISCGYAKEWLKFHVQNLWPDVVKNLLFITHIMAWLKAILKVLQTFEVKRLSFSAFQVPRYFNSFTARLFDGVS